MTLAISILILLHSLGIHLKSYNRRTSKFEVIYPSIFRISRH